MAEDEIKDKSKDTSTDAKVKAGIEKVVEKKIVEHRIIPDYKPKDSSKNKKSKNDKSPTAKDIDSLQKQLDESAKARKEAEDALLESQKQLGVSGDEVDRQKAILQAMALKAFEEQKKLVIEKVRSTSGDEKAEEVANTIQSGEDLERMRGWLKIFGDTFSKREGDAEGETGEPVKTPSAGKVTMPIVPASGNVEEFSNVGALVNEVYDKLEEQQFLKYMEMPYDQKTLEEYQKKADKLLKSLVSGELKREKFDFSWKIIQCACSHIMTGGETKCPECGRNILHRTQGGLM